jgi:hypothetical protein
VIDPAALQMVLGVLTGWLDRREREAVAYLMEENRLLRRQLGSSRLRLTDGDRRRLAARGASGGPCGAARDRHDRHARHLTALASAVNCAEVDLSRRSESHRPAPRFERAWTFERLFELADDVAGARLKAVQTDVDVLKGGANDHKEVAGQHRAGMIAKERRPRLRVVPAARSARHVAPNRARRHGETELQSELRRDPLLAPGTIGDAHIGDELLEFGGNPRTTAWA